MSTASAIFAFLGVLLLLTGCAGGKKLAGKIAHIYGGTLLIAGTDGDLYFAAIGDADTDGEKLAAGQDVLIEYRGGIRETYPAEVEKVLRITPTGEQSNPVDLYVAVTKEVLGDAQYSALAYDFSQTKQLSDAEQLAVGYICWTELDAEPYYGTWETLLEEGILSEKDGTVFLREGCLLRYVREDDDPEHLTVILQRGAQTTETYVYQLAEADGVWTSRLTETPEA